MSGISGRNSQRLRMRVGVWNCLKAPPAHIWVLGRSGLMAELWWSGNLKTHRQPLHHGSIQAVTLLTSVQLLCRVWLWHPVIRWPKYWSFSFSISPSNEYSGLISFRINWLDLPAVQGILKSLLQHHSSKASVLQCSAFFMVQFSHLCMTTGKTVAWTRWTFAAKECLCFLICYLGWSYLFFLGASIF